MKLKIEDILKPGYSWDIRKVDFDDPEIKKTIEELKQRQRECLERKKIDWNKLRNMIINI